MKTKLTQWIQHHVSGLLHVEAKRRRDMTMLAQADILDFKPPVDVTARESLGGVWADFIGSVTSIGKGGYHNRAEMMSVLNHNMVLMHKLLLSSTTYRNLVNSAFNNLVRTKYWGWRSIHEDALGKVGLFSMYKDSPVPLHDHPGTCGVMMVVDGEVEVERYRLTEVSRKKEASGLVEMESCDRKLLKPFEITWFDETEGNIHGFETKTEQCVMLKVQIPAMVSGSRSWYFPTCVFDSERKSIQARRIMSQHL